MGVCAHTYIKHVDTHTHTLTDISLFVFEKSNASILLSLLFILSFSRIGWSINRSILGEIFFFLSSNVIFDVEWFFFFKNLRYSKILIVAVLVVQISSIHQHIKETQDKLHEIKQRMSNFFLLLVFSSSKIVYLLQNLYIKLCNQCVFVIKRNKMKTSSHEWSQVKQNATIKWTHKTM